MSSMIRDEAIAPEIGYREWVKAYRTDVDTIPVLLAVLVELSTPSLSSSRTDNVRVSGSRPSDYAPVSDTGHHWELDHFWSAVCAYVTAVHAHVGGVTPITGLRAAGRPTTPESARAAGNAIADWLESLVEQIVDWADLAPTEAVLQGEIHRGRARFLSSWQPRRETPGICTTCGQNRVRTVWELLDGQALRVRTCTNCGEHHGRAPIPRRWLGSPECLRGDHADCKSLNCECSHHTGTTEGEHP